jgi:hypothetical protein
VDDILDGDTDPDDWQPATFTLKNGTCTLALPPGMLTDISCDCLCNLGCTSTLNTVLVAEPAEPSMETHIRHAPCLDL